MNTTQPTAPADVAALLAELRSVADTSTSAWCNRRLPGVADALEALARDLSAMRQRYHASVEMGLEETKKAETLARERDEARAEADAALNIANTVGMSANELMADNARLRAALEEIAEPIVAPMVNLNSPEAARLLADAARYRREKARAALTPAEKEPA